MNLWIFLASKKMNGEIIFLIQVLVQQVAFRDIFYQKKEVLSKKEIISFYIDAESLLKRAYVLRQEGWRKKENVGYYQRMLDAKKIVSMRRYLSSERRVFINNIITTISENDIRMYKDQNRREEIVIDEYGNFPNPLILENEESFSWGNSKHRPGFFPFQAKELCILEFDDIIRIYANQLPDNRSIFIEYGYQCSEVSDGLSLAVFVFTKEDYEYALEHAID